MAENITRFAVDAAITTIKSAAVSVTDVTVIIAMVERESRNIHSVFQETQKYSDFVKSISR
jgi:hypothetical protein